MSDVTVRDNTSGWWTIAAVLLVAFLVRLVFMVGLVGSDDLHYATYAHQIATGTFSPTSYFHALRLGIIGPTALAYRLFGVSAAATVWFPLVCSLLSVFVVYLLGRELFGHSAGLWGAVIYAVFPVDVVQAGLLMPDVPVATFAGLALLFVLYGERVESGPVSLLSFAAAGLLLGLGYMCKVTAVLPTGVLLLYAVLRRKRLHCYAVMLVTLGLIVAIEGVYYRQVNGDFFFRLNVLRQWDHTLADGMLAGPLASLSEYPRAMFLSIEEFGLFWYLFVAAAVWAVTVRLKRTWVVMLWVILLWLYLQFGISSFRQLTFPAHVPRYLILVTIPAAALVGAMLAGLGRRRHRVVLSIVVALVVLSSLFFTGLHATLVGSRVWNSKQVARQLKELPRRPTYVLLGRAAVDWSAGLGQCDLRELYRSHDPQTGAKADPVPVETLTGSYVVVDRRLIGFHRERHELKLPDYLEEIPSDWRKVIEIRNDFSGLKYAPVRLVRWALDRKLIPGPVGTRFESTLSRVTRDHHCIVYAVPGKELQP